MTTTRTQSAPATAGAINRGELVESCRKTTTKAVAKQPRKRRTKAEIQHLLESVHNVLGEYSGDAITIRHLFYRLANDHQVIDKSEKAYNNLRSLLVKWRRGGQIDFDAFLDGTRWHYGFEGYADGIEGMLDLARRQYRLNLWQATDRYIELWVEKDAVASIVHPIASEWNLKTFISRGDASMSSLSKASKAFKAARHDRRHPTIIYLGDYDEVGLDIPNVIQRNLRDDHGVEVELIRAAITHDQIDAWSLPTRPPKGARRGQSIDRAVEVDVMRPEQIRAVVCDIIETMVDPAMIERMKQIEAAEVAAITEGIRLPAFQSRLTAAWGGDATP